jgi:hypothetical protein
MFNVLKWLGIVFLPAFAALYVGLANVWNLPYPEQISGTITAVVLFLGMVLQIGNAIRFHAVTETNMSMSFVPIDGVLFSSGVYDVIKWLVQIGLPALSTLYVALASIWNLPFGPEVSKTIMIIVAFLGSLVAVSYTQFQAFLKHNAMLSAKQVK